MSTDIAFSFMIPAIDQGCRPAHMKQLFRLCKAKTVIWKELPYGDHNNTVAESGYFNYIDEFIENYVVRG